MFDIAQLVRIKAAIPTTYHGSTTTMITYSLFGLLAPLLSFFVYFSLAFQSIIVVVVVDAVDAVVSSLIIGITVLPKILS